MRILPIIARLKAQCALLGNRVEPAQSLTSLDDSEIGTDLPIAFVLPLKEAATENMLINKVSQRVPKQFGIIIAAANSDGVDEPLEDVRDQIKAALTGWSYGADYEDAEYVGGEIINVTTRLVWWRDIYTTANYNRS